MPVAPRAPAPAAPRRPSNTGGQFDVNSEIGRLLAEHQRLNPTPAPAPAPRRAQPQPHVPQRSQVSIQQMQVIPVQFAQHQPRQQHQPRPQVQSPARNIAANPNIPTTNTHGIVVNPKRFPGPLAHDLPAGVGGPISPTGFTAEVAAARQNLVRAHQAILAQQAALPRPVK